MELKEPNVDRLLDSISLLQLKEWQEIASEEPLPSEKIDWLFASVCAAIWDVNRDTKKHPNRFPVEDFILKFQQRKPGVTQSQTPEEKQHILMLWALAYAGTKPDTYRNPATG